MILENIEKPIKKGRVKQAYHSFLTTLTSNLKPFGFRLRNGYLVRKSHDILEGIWVDNQSSSEPSDHFELKIITAPPLWKYDYCTCCLDASDVIPELDYCHQLEADYKPLAHKLTSSVIEHVLDFFDDFNCSKTIVTKLGKYFPKPPFWNYFTLTDLILYAELKTKQLKYTEDILHALTSQLNEWNTNDEYMQFMFTLRDLFKSERWNSIDQLLRKNELAMMHKWRLA